MRAAVPPFAVVIPSLGRPTLRVLLESLAVPDGPTPQEVVVVDDRRGEPAPLELAVTGLPRSRVLRGFGHGPAAARNLGWRVTSAPWVVFVDDDVVLPQGWSRALAGDLDAASAHHAGIQARLDVPHRGGPPTDWERATLGLRTSAWITADM